MFVFSEVLALLNAFPPLDFVSRRISGLSPHGKVVLALATTVLLLELGLRRFAPKSGAYRAWTGAFAAVGAFWTAVILSIVYFVSVAAISLGMKLFAKDPLDRGLSPEPTFWRPHEPNPLGLEAAARHQF